MPTPYPVASVGSIGSATRADAAAPNAPSDNAAIARPGTVGARSLKWSPTLAAAPLRSSLYPQRGPDSRRGKVTRAAGEGPLGHSVAGIGGQCETAHQYDSHCADF